MNEEVFQETDDSCKVIGEREARLKTSWHFAKLMKIGQVENKTINC